MIDWKDIFLFFALGGKDGRIRKLEPSISIENETFLIENTMFSLL